MTDGIQYIVTILGIDARVSGLKKARIHFVNSSAEGRLDISKHPQLKVHQQVSVLLERKFPDNPSWVDVVLDPAVLDRSPHGA
jgi:hypothetical protein